MSELWFAARETTLKGALVLFIYIICFVNAGFVKRPCRAGLCFVYFRCLLKIHDEMI